jgi:hypothetical protein
MWDFNGMDKSLRSFRTLEPFEAHAISAVKYSVTGDKILVTSGKVQAKVCNVAHMKAPALLNPGGHGQVDNKLFGR